MKKLLLYGAIGIGSLIAIFAIIVVVVLVISNNETERERNAYSAGFAFGTFIVILIGGLVLFGLFKLTINIFFKKDNDDTNIDNDAPIDHYLK